LHGRFHENPAPGRFRRHLRSSAFLSAVLTLAVLAGGAQGGNKGVLTMGDCPEGAPGARLQLTIDGVRSAKGEVTVVVYSDKREEFLVAGKKLVKVHFPARPGQLRGCVLLPKPGVYALAAYHDEDGDRHLTRSVLGMPEEGYTFSNNPSTLFGLPSFRAVLFAAKAAVTPMPLKLHYP
jgi:uncharacterized protein (DUF2141 family)